MLKDRKPPVAPARQSLNLNLTLNLNPSVSTQARGIKIKSKIKRMERIYFSSLGAGMSRYVCIICHVAHGNSNTHGSPSRVTMA